MEDGGFDLPDPTFFPGGNELNTVRSFDCTRCIHATPPIYAFNCSGEKGLIRAIYIVHDCIWLSLITWSEENGSVTSLYTP